MFNDVDKQFVDRDQARFNKLLRAIFTIVELAGFRLDGRIKVTDLRTNKTYE